MDKGFFMITIIETYEIQNLLSFSIVILENT